VTAPVLSVDGLTREYRNRGVTARVLDAVSVEVGAGRTLAVVGESGAGKSTLARLICGLDRPTAGTVRVAGRDPAPRSGAPSPVQLVFQNPIDALNPFLAIGRSIGEPLRSSPRERRQARIAELLQRVGIDPERAGQRPAAFSGGQLQRIVLARALAASPQVLVCDEPTSALDVSVQAQIVNLLLELQAAMGFACVLVTHDLAVVRVLAHDVLVLRHGRTVEVAPADRFFAAPREEYSRSLLDAVARQALSRHEWYDRTPALGER
jgi:ABC-type glutathione transport system ATPase component